MFRPGRILQLGGNSSGAAVIDINGGGTPAVTPTQSLSSQRQWVNATILADGKVLATGGSQVDNQLIGVNNKAEIWNPTTGQWTAGPVGAQAAAVPLQRDPAARRQRAGHRRRRVDRTAAVRNNLNVGDLLPAVLLRRRRAARVAADHHVGARLGRHRRGLPRRRRQRREHQPRDAGEDRSGDAQLQHGPALRGPDVHRERHERCRVQAPTRAADATPGYYMLFVFDAAGVPSVAQDRARRHRGGAEPGDRRRR